MSMQNQSVVQDSIDSLVDVLNTQAFAKDQIEDTRDHASKPQAQSSLMNYPSKEFIQMDKRKWNDIPVCGIIERNPLEWKITKRITNLVRHRDIDHREIDGAVHWSSLCPKLRREFESEGARTSSDSQLLGCIHRGSNKPRFKKRVNSNNSLLYVRALQGHSAGELLAPELMNHVACSTQMVRIPVSCGKLFLP